VDERPELDEIYSNVTTSSAHTSPGSKTGESPLLSTGPALPVPLEESISIIDPVTWSPQSLYSGAQNASPTKRRRTNDSPGTQTFHSPLQASGFHLYHVNPAGSAGPTLEQETNIESLLRAADLADNGFHQADLLSTPIQANVQPYLSAGQSPTNYWPDVDAQEACLLRYFIDNLACWVGKPLYLHYKQRRQNN
jgi:hypothetical protein